jgi:hypothetical protein
VANFKKLQRLLFRKSRRLLPLHSKAINPDQMVDLGQYVSFPDGYRPTNPTIARYGSEGSRSAGSAAKETVADR